MHAADARRETATNCRRRAQPLGPALLRLASPSDLPLVLTRAGQRRDSISLLTTVWLVPAETSTLATMHIQAAVSRVTSTAICTLRQSQSSLLAHAWWATNAGQRVLRSRRQHLSKGWSLKKRSARCRFAQPAAGKMSKPLRGRGCFATPNCCNGFSNRSNSWNYSRQTHET